MKICFWEMKKTENHMKARRISRKPKSHGGPKLKVKWHLRRYLHKKDK